MYTEVSLKYNGENINKLFVAVYPSFPDFPLSKPYCVIHGIPCEFPFPIAIGALGVYKNASSAFKRISEIAEKYPPIDCCADFPELKL